MAEALICCEFFFLLLTELNKEQDVTISHLSCSARAHLFANYLVVHGMCCFHRLNDLFFFPFPFFFLYLMCLMCFPSTAKPLVGEVNNVIFPFAVKCTCLFVLFVKCTF